VPEPFQVPLNLTETTNTEGKRAHNLAPNIYSISPHTHIPHPPGNTTVHTSRTWLATAKDAAGSTAKRRYESTVTARTTAASASAPRGDGARTAAWVHVCSTSSNDGRVALVCACPPQGQRGRERERESRGSK
jgi:hypothetical protein